MLAVASSAFAQKTVKVKGTIDDPSIKKLYIQVGVEDSYGLYNPADSVEVKNGKFTYTTKLNKIVPAWIKTENTDKAPTTTAYLVPNEKLNLTIQNFNCIHNGSKVYKEMNDAYKFYSEVREKFDSYYDSALARVSNATEEEKPALNKSINDSLGVKYYEMNQSIVNYRKQHLDSEGALLYLSDHDDVEMMYSDLMVKDNNFNDPDFLKKNRVAAYLKSRIDHIIAMRKFREEQDSIEQAKLDAMHGTPAKDFTLNDIKGNPLSLSSLRGKYVILDFWGSWCGWCIKGIPDMKKYYEKYAGKFEILGVDCRDSESAWKNAVEKYELPWLHVYNPKDSSITSDYNITGYPTKIIIDHNGNINKIVVGEDPEFYTYLDELFTK